MPIPVLTIAQMRAWEEPTWRSGQTETEVIRRVGKCLAEHALNMSRPGDDILILAGRGHNGDDARLARQHLPDRKVQVFDIIDPANSLPKLEAQLSLRPALIIDGLFGIGLNRPLSNAWISFIHRVNQAQTRILAVDVPSGLNADTGEPLGAAIQATVTLAVGAPKLGLLQPAAWPYVGRLEVATNIGLIPCPETSELNWTLPSDFSRFPPRRLAATHKGDYGHLAIIAGSLGYHGAAVLAARAAQRAQPGLITLHTLETVYPVIASQLQAVMVSPWRPGVDLATGAWDAFLIGPGLASSDVPEDLRALVRRLWMDAPVPVIVDASALYWLTSEKPRSTALRLITPHPGEAARLLRSTPPQVQLNRLNSLRSLSSQFGNTWVVLKGHQTLIGRSAGDVFLNSSGNPHLAQGGSGDALSGFLGGLLVQAGLCADPSKTIRYAVWQHGATADLLQATRPNWVVEDLAEALGTASPQ